MLMAIKYSAVGSGFLLDVLYFCFKMFVRMALKFDFKSSIKRVVFSANF